MGKGTDGPRLLVREREELDRVAHRLRVEGPAFVLLVCAPRLREVVLSVLQRHEHLAGLPAPMRLETAEAVLAELSEERALRSVALGAAEDPMRAVNWHREKVRREGATVLWLEDVDALERFREVAPDAYSFRDGLVIVDGVPELRVEGVKEERAELKLARRRFDRAKSGQERLEAGGEYLHELANAGRWDDALKLARSLRASFWICTRSLPSRILPLAKVARDIASALGNGSANIEQMTFIRSALPLFANDPSLEVQARVAELLSVVPDPKTGWQADAVAQAHQIASALSFPHRAILTDVLRYRAVICQRRGQVSLAKRVSVDVSQRIVGELSKLLAKVQIAGILIEEGNSAEALAWIQKAWADGSRTTLSPTVGMLAHLYTHSSEIEAARHLLESSRSGFDETSIGHMTPVLTSLAAVSGDADSLLSSLERVLANPPMNCDGAVYGACGAGVHIHDALYSADRLDAATVVHWDTLLESAQALLLSWGETDPPWYRVLMPELRARLFALRLDRRSDALSLFREAWELGRARYPEAAPGVAVRLVNTLFAAGELADIPALLDDAEAIARTRERLNDQMALCVHRIRYAVLAGADPAVVPALRGQLDALFEESGSLVLQGNTLLDLSRALAPDTLSPDPLRLAEEARALFSGMRMPHEEALCVERIGEILFARGDRPAARQRFQYALQRRRTYGLGMRIPRLERLLAMASESTQPS